MNRLRVRKLSKTYPGNSSPALAQIDFDLQENHLLALVGESGSGKSTLLRLLAGLEEPNEGEIFLDEASISSPGKITPPESRNIGLVFQHHALFPHLSVEKNIAFGLRQWTRAQKRKRVGELLDLVGLSGFEARYPHQLSGGERQRVALARALAPSPKLLLLDEPFSSLDALLRQSVRDETRRILQESQTTSILVTHDTGDALSIADEIIVLKDGIKQQAAAPQEIYRHPSTPYVAALFGTCNFLMEKRDLEEMGLDFPRIGPPDSQSPELWVRPEDLELCRPESSRSPQLVGRVTKISFQGSYQEVVLQCAISPARELCVTVRHDPNARVELGEQWAISPKVSESMVSSH